MLARPPWLAAASAYCRRQPQRPLQLQLQLQSQPEWRLARSHRPQRRQAFSCSTSPRQKADDKGDDKIDLYDTTTKEVRERKEELEQAQIEAYPRIRAVESPSRVPVTVSAWLQAQSAQRTDSSTEKEDSPGKPASKPTVCAGRIIAIRSSGKKLVFFDLRTDTATVQVKLNYGALPESNRPSLDEFQSLWRLLRRGDHILVHAIPSSTREGKPALEATGLPLLQSPCLQRFPVSADRAGPESEQGHVRTDLTPIDRHVEMLTNLDAVRMIKTRHVLLQGIRQFLIQQHGFVEVQTPILAGHAGGAIARAFETTATEFADRKLSLRIAPELWLKRLMIGGLSRVFEIGPSFRNEGLDKTHNPEFTTCEFYAAYWTIDKLKAVTEELIKSLAAQVAPDWQEQSKLDNAAGGGPGSSLPCIDFIPALNSILGMDLPNLCLPSARTDVLAIFDRAKISIPDRPTLPRLLDELSAQFLEPQCSGPTWIVNTPACLSPLAKSFIHPTAANHQAVAARAELFVGGKEVVNCYEEENDPFEQRRKMLDQQCYARGEVGAGAVHDDEAMKVDEEYIKAMEWGLPPTGGWGMGVDRLLMLLTGRERIADVLTFGNLRAVTRGGERRGRRRMEPT